MFKADIGDLLYIIIFAILILLGGLEKVFKAKRQPTKTPNPPQPYDDFEDVDEQSPQSIEDVMKRMLQTLEDSQEEAVVYEKAQQKFVPEELPLHLTNKYQPVCDTFGELEKTQFPQNHLIEETQEVGGFQGIGFEFDIRQAVIASEILNRKY